MSTSLLSSLRECADRLTEQNCSAQPQAAPPYAFQSPLHEVLAEEVAASLPPPLAAKLRSANSLGELHEWLAAAAIYRTAEGEPTMLDSLMRELDADPNPGRAVSAYIKAMVERELARLHDKRWRSLDLLGVLLGLPAVAAVLLARCVLLVFASTLVSQPINLPLAPMVTLWPAAVLSVAPTNYTGAALLSVAILWFTLEGIGVPFAFEYLRRLPARRARALAPVLSRTDAFYIAWLAHAIAWVAWASLTGALRFCVPALGASGTTAIRVGAAFVGGAIATGTVAFLVAIPRLFRMGQAAKALQA